MMGRPLRLSKRKTSRGYESISLPIRMSRRTLGLGRVRSGIARRLCQRKLRDRCLIGGKTPEELALENEGLRASLDTLASQAHALEKANKALREMAEEREKTMRTVVNGVRREVSFQERPRCSSSV